MNEPPPRQVRSDEETLGEIFNGSPYAVDADVDPHADWVPRAEQVFDEKKLMQMSIFKKEVYLQKVGPSTERKST